MIAEGKLTGYRIGRVYRIDLNELESAMLPRQTVKAG
jgi:excisionase family DNA binding protein